MKFHKNSVESFNTVRNEVNDLIKDNNRIINQLKQDQEKLDPSSSAYKNNQSLIELYTGMNSYLQLALNSINEIENDTKYEYSAKIKYSAEEYHVKRTKNVIDIEYEDKGTLLHEIVHIGQYLLSKEGILKFTDNGYLINPGSNATLRAAYEVIAYRVQLIYAPGKAYYFQELNQGKNYQSIDIKFLNQFLSTYKFTNQAMIIFQNMNKDNPNAEQSYYNSVLGKLLNGK